MPERTPYDGKPYYCTICGLGLAEYMACDETDCKIESTAQAQARAGKQRAIGSDLARHEQARKAQE